jgi:vitamin B12 transporter
MYSKTLKKILFIPLMLAISFSIGLSQNRESGEQKNGDAVRIDEIVVTATKTEINKKETGASITVITEKEIEQRGKQMIIDVLRDVPGITTYQTGTFGGLSSVFIRGADAKNLLVLIDGIKMNDPSNIDRSFDFANLTTDNIERIEIVRGPQSTLYGSDATAGVINIITKRGMGKPKLTIKAEGGSYSTFRESVSINGGTDKTYYSFLVSRTDSCGFSKASKESGVTRELEDDRYENTTISTRLGYSPFSKSWITLAFRYTDAYTEIDDGAFYDDPNYAQENKQMSSILGFNQEIAKWWRHKISLSYMNIVRRYRDKTDADEPIEFSDSWFQGNHKRGEWQHIITIDDIDEITGGIEYEQNSATSLDYSDIGYGPSTTEFDEQRVSTAAYYLQNHLKLLKRIFVIAGVRLNDHEEFGTKSTYQLSVSVLIPLVETRLKGNYATGYRAPQLSQLYDTAWTTGNKDLKPEESKSYDFGIEQPIWGNRFIIDATYFVTTYDNKIDLDAAFKYINKERVDTSGLEGSLRFKPTDTFLIDASYTYTKEAEDSETGKRLLRRPKHQASAYLNWSFIRGANINIGVIYVGKRDDAWYDESIFTTRYVELDDYYVVNLAASYGISDNLQIFGRIENLTNEEYENPVGYEPSKRSYYGGLKAIF